MIITSVQRIGYTQIYPTYFKQSYTKSDTEKNEEFDFLALTLLELISIGP